MKIFMYRTSGGKDLLKKISREVKPVVLTILLGLQEDGVKNFIVKPIDKNISPTLYEIKKNGVVALSVCPSAKFLKIIAIELRQQAHDWIDKQLRRR